MTITTVKIGNKTEYTEVLMCACGHTQEVKTLGCKMERRQVKIKRLNPCLRCQVAALVEENMEQMNKWEKTSEKMPRSRSRVLVVVKMKHGGNLWTTMAEWVPKHTVLVEDFLDPDCDSDFFDEGADGREYAPEGWYESPLMPDNGFMLDGDVQYWMKIPAKPLF